MSRAESSSGKPGIEGKPNRRLWCGGPIQCDLYHAIFFRVLVDRSGVGADLVGCTGLAAFHLLSVQLEKISDVWKVGCTSRPDDWKSWKTLQ